VSDGSARGRGDDELPPDPWAGLAGPTRWTGADRPERPPGWESHPSVTPGSSTGHLPPPRRTLWHHPAVWVALLVVAGLLLVGALLEPSPAPPREPSPDAVTASVAFASTPVGR
jgi:hypothetical protein